MRTGFTQKKAGLMKYNNLFSRLLNASRYSLQGLSYAVRKEQGFQYEAVVFIFVCAAVIILRLPAMHAALLAGVWLIVMCLGLVNSALEKAFDLISDKYSPVIKAGKDMLSASVFIAVCMNIILWLIAIIKYLI